MKIAMIMEDYNCCALTSHAKIMQTNAISKVTITTLIVAQVANGVYYFAAICKETNPLFCLVRSWDAAHPLKREPWQTCGMYDCMCLSLPSRT